MANPPNTGSAVLRAASAGDASAIIETMKELHGAKLLDVPGGHDGEAARQVLLVPNGFRLESPKRYLDEYRTAPERRKGTAVLTDLDSFIQHANRFRDGDSVVFAHRDEDKPSMTSVLDYHRQKAEGAPRFGEHRGTYAFPLSEAWQAWAKVDGEPMGQPEFAAFIEERVMDIVIPPTDGRNDAGALALDLLGTVGGEFAGPQKMLEISRGLKLNENSEVQNAQNLQSGEVQLVFKTQHTDALGQPLKVPSMFIVQAPVFEGGAAYKMPVRIRYRTSHGRITWTMARYRPDLIFFHAFDQAAERVKKETELPLFMGSAER
ncbi:DUF2303 family protein [Rhodovarius crocodyli]|uniref:DUF2303 family protein n=1 Tax=Rhodovarius crocodyli TaxID=1979269 RepID=A0A437MN51_9PROT|nr:DUF2303 family protein [Rhodovarius crocodyli]RVT99066.1 DUF2303 family protein [Rhodovarius crocodyli]